MKLIDDLRQRRESINSLAARYGASNVRVFGSVAHGEETPESDIDLLVDFEAGRSLLDHAGLVLELEELLARTVEVGTTKGLKDRYRNRILGESVPL